MRRERGTVTVEYIHFGNDWIGCGRKRLWSTPLTTNAQFEDTTLPYFTEYRLLLCKFVFAIHVPAVFENTILKLRGKQVKP